MALTSTEGDRRSVELDDTGDAERRSDGQASEAAGTAAARSPASAGGRTFSSPAKVTDKNFGVAPSGMLLLTGGRLSFTTPRGTMFDVPVEQVKNIETPRMQLGAGFTCMIQGRKYTVAFAKADMAAYNAAMQTARLAGGVLAVAGVGLGLVGAVKTLAEFGNARATCEVWLTVLSSPYGSTGPSLFSDTPLSGGAAATPAAPPAGERACPKCGTSFTRLSVQCPNCGAIST